MSVCSIRFFIYVAGVALFLLTGCRTSTEGLAQLTEFDAAILRTGVLFSLSVEVGDEIEFVSKDLRVGENGEVVLPIIRDVNLDGLTLVEAADRLATLYEPYYVETPTVRLRLEMDAKGAPWGYVTVLGRVTKPGRVSLPPTRDMTVSGAIRAAGGFDTSANLKAIRIIRTNKDQTKERKTINIKRLGKDGDTTQDVRLRAGDVVFVSERIF
jgi:protein involved in polysaccharide export with SLBB domain